MSVVAKRAVVAGGAMSLWLLLAGEVTTGALATALLIAAALAAWAPLVDI